MKEHQMENTHVGIWIDQNEAMVVTLIDSRPVVELVRANAASHNFASDESGTNASPGAGTSPKNEVVKKRREYLRQDFYGEVIVAIGEAGHLYIFGPGNSKSELAAEIEKIRRHHYHIDAVEAADMLAENQIVAKVKSYFKPALSS